MAAIKTWMADMEEFAFHLLEEGAKSRTPTWKLRNEFLDEYPGHGKIFDRTYAHYQLDDFEDLMDPMWFNSTTKVSYIDKE